MIFFGRRCHDAPPAAPGVLLDEPALLCSELFGARLVKMRADRLARVLEGGIVAVDQGLRHHCDRLSPDAAPAELVAKCFQEHVADRALKVGARIVHRYGRDFVDGDFGAPQHEPHLRAVAVGDDDVPAGLDHVGDVMGDDRDLIVLVRDSYVIFANQRIAADRHERKVFRRRHALLAITRRALMRRAPLRPS